MNTCGTCAYFGEEILKIDHDNPDSIYDDQPTGYHKCELLKHCTSDTYQGYKEMQGGSFVIDGSGYYAALVVKYDFGCNRWESK